MFTSLEALTTQAEQDAEIQNHSKSRDDDHRCLLHRFRVQDALIAFPEEKQRKDNQRQSVDERGEDSTAMIAVSFYIVGRFRLKVKADQCQDQRKCIGEIVTRIGD